MDHTKLSNFVSLIQVNVQQISNLKMLLFIKKETTDVLNNFLLNTNNLLAHM